MPGFLTETRRVQYLENGEIVPDKPPLAHWLAATAAWARARLAAGRPVSRLEAAERFDEWALRFPSALCACLLVASVAVLGAAFVGERAALFAAAALLTSAQFWYQARLGRVDMALACFASIATLLAGRAVLEGRARLLMAAAAAAALAVLANGLLIGAPHSLSSGITLILEGALIASAVFIVFVIRSPYHGAFDIGPDLIRMALARFTTVG